MKTKSLEKAYEITDAKIQFVSLVDKAANKHTFLITKQEGGKASFTSCGRIIKADADNHYVTGIVYEPMTEDVHGNYMTEDEITKAAYWFAKNGDKVDLQHTFEPLQDAQVVENWVEKADTEIEGQPIKKGTWLMTVEVSDQNIWDEIMNGEITGFSMGGLGNYSEEDTDLSNVEKSQESSEKRGLLKQIADALGFKIVEKDKVTEVYQKQAKEDLFWDAFTSLQNALEQWDYMSDEEVYEQDEEKIRAALAEFNEIVASILTADEPIVKALYPTKPDTVRKAGRELSSKNQKALQSIYDDLGAFLDEFRDSDDASIEPVTEEEDTKDTGKQSETGGKNAGDDSGKKDGLDDDKKSIKKEDTEMTRTEVESIVQEAVTKAVEAYKVQEPVEQPGEGTEAMTPESIKKMVDEAVQKAVKPQDEQVTPEQVQEMVTKAVGEAMDPLLKSHGLPTSLNDTVEKGTGQHYLHGIL